MKAIKFNYLLTSIKVHDPFITTLKISFCQLTGNELQMIEQADFKFLKNLDLSGNFIGGVDIQYLIKAHWPFLKRVDFTFNKIGNRGLAYLIKCKWLKCVQFLNLS